MPSNARQLLGLVLCAVFLLPFHASASTITFDGYKTVNFEWTGFAIDDNIDGLGCPQDTTEWAIVATSVSNIDYFSQFFPIGQTSGSLLINAPAGTPMNGANAYCGSPNFSGSSNNFTTLGLFTLQDPTFQVITAPQSTVLLSNVENGVRSTGSTLWVIVALAVSIPLTFYVIHSVAGLFPNKKR